MLMLERFQQILPEIARIKRVAEDGETAYWEAYDESGALVGFAFYLEVPESQPDLPEVEEFDKYEVLGIVNPEFKIVSLDIAPHPEGPKDMWAGAVIESKFKEQFLGLSAEEVKLSPEGKIDAVAEGTISSTLVTNAIRGKIDEISEGAAGAP